MKSHAFYATVAHYRFWLFADGEFYRARADAGEFTPDLIRRMARYYSVSRTIPSVDPEKESNKHANAHREIVADKLNKLDKIWPNTLRVRGERVIETALAIQKAIGSGNPPYSAVSKFIWFARPENWTLFDALASAGMLPDGGKSGERVNAFYQALDEILPALTVELRPICQASGLPLHPEKIIDISLMLRGAERIRPDFSSDMIASCEHFLKLMPAETSRSLELAAQEIARHLTDDALPRPCRVQWRKRTVTY